MSRVGKLSRAFSTIDDPRIYKRLKKMRDVRCTYCPYNRGENAKSYLYKRKKKEFQLPKSKRWFGRFL